MDGMVFDHDSGDDDDEIGHLHTGTFHVHRDATRTSEDEEHDGDEGKSGDKGKQSRAASSAMKAAFSSTKRMASIRRTCRALPYYDFVSARRKGSAVAPPDERSGGAVPSHIHR